MVFGIIWHKDCERHPAPTQHPESPARITTIQDQLVAQGLDLLMSCTETRVATTGQLERVHSAGYVKRMFSLAESGREHWPDVDACFTPETLTAALRAASACVEAVDPVMESDVRHGLNQGSMIWACWSFRYIRQ